jgi:hypothetical protein
MVIGAGVEARPIRHRLPALRSSFILAETLGAVEELAGTPAVLVQHEMDSWRSPLALFEFTASHLQHHSPGAGAGRVGSPLWPVLAGTWRPTAYCKCSRLYDTEGRPGAIPGLFPIGTPTR